MILTESYFGKDAILQDCEACLLEMKEAITRGTNPNKIAAKTRFESNIAKKFNCEKVYLSILADESGLNAYTMPFFYEKNRSNDDEFFKLVTDSSGIHYKNATGKVLYVYINTYTIRNYDVISLMAILLHEVGHNFFFIKEQIQNRRAKAFTEMVIYLLQVLDQYNYDPGLTKEVIRIIIENGIQFKKGIQSDSYERVMKYLTDKAFDIANGKYEAKHTGIGKMFYTLFTAAGKIIGSVFGLVNTAITTLLLPLLITSATYKQLSREQKGVQSYNAEKFCDNFAASFGYAAGVVKTFNNSGDFTYSSKVSSKIPIVRILDYYSDVLYYFVAYMNDEHPSHQRRVIFAAEKLKYELDKNRNNMSPKQIEEIEKDLADVEQLIKKTPYFKKAINSAFSGIDAKRDKAGSVGVKDADIYDFDKKVIADKVSKESCEFNFNEHTMNTINEEFFGETYEVLNEENSLLDTF